MFKLRTVVAAAVLAVSLASAQPAQAAESIIKENATHDRQHFDVFGLVGFWGWGFHFGAGAWYAFPILPEGFLPKVNDAFFIEVGGAVERYSNDYGVGAFSCDVSWYRVTPLGGARWSFYFTDEWSAYGTAKLGFGIGFGGSVDCGGLVDDNSVDVDYSELVGDGAVGAHWQFSDTWAMRFELGYFGATVGAGFDL